MKYHKKAEQAKENNLCDGVTSEERARYLKNIPWDLRVIKPHKSIELKTLIYVCDKTRPAWYMPQVAGGIHDFWKIMLIINGRAEVVLGDKKHILTDGMMVINPPMRFNDFREIDGNELKFMIVYAEISGEDMQFFEENSVFKLSSKEQDDFMRSVESLNNYYIGMCNRKYLQKGVVLFEAFLIDLLIRSEQKDISKVDKRYGEIIKILNRHIDEKLTVAMISQECGMSVSLIKKIFSANSNCGIMAYFNKMKLRRAAELIEYGLSNDEIATQLSFSSTTYFLYFFRREMGMSPKKYLESIKHLNDK